MPGLSWETSSYPSPKRRIEPGARFSRTTSQDLASSRNIFLPWGCFRSRVTLLTPWARLRKRVERSLLFWGSSCQPLAPAKGPFPRTGSPLPGISTLMTSAPNRARFMAQNGPAK